MDQLVHLPRGEWRVNGWNGLIKRSRETVERLVRVLGW
jgi:hypothetical protein